MSDPVMQFALFGESHVGKSHYGAQLVGRLNAESGVLRMRGAAPDLTAFDDVRQSLNEGVPAAHTSAGTYFDTLLPVRATGDVAVDLNWPDYAGEQISQILENRLIPPGWRQRVEVADGWVLMVRPKSASLAEDIFSHPLGDLQSPRPTVSTLEPSTQARLVELLQMLIYARQKPKPALVVLLSCWDELEDAHTATPKQVLAKILPLLASFIENNWDADSRLLFGLSATEVALSKDRPNADFICKGADRMGYVVRPDGSRTTDLTSPIAELADTVRRKC